MKRFIKSRKTRYGSVALVLSVLVLVAVIIVNMIAASLAGRYEWMYVNMNSNLIYSISDACESYLSDHVFSVVDETNASLAQEGKEPLKLKIIFCDDMENVTSDQTRKYIHDSVYEIGELFPGYVTVEYLNIWEQPSIARYYGVTSTSDVICEFGERFETMNLADFFVFESTDSTNPVGYNGEKIIASCLMRVTQEASPMCYLTANHGETFGDYEFIRTVVEAGYTVGFLDLAIDDIPDDCDLLVTFNPKQDLIISDNVSSTSEVDKIDAFMGAGGKYMVFLSADTFASGAHENLEGLLAEWGISYMHKEGEGGIEECYLIKDSANSLTVDGYTVVSEHASVGNGVEIMNGLGETNVFGNTTCIAFTEQFVSDGNGNYVATVEGKERCAFPLMVSHSTAEAWANGRAVARASENPFVLMSMSTQTCENGEQAYLIASASTDFAGESLMQSSVLGNSRTIAKLLSYMGKDNAPVDLVFKPFGGTDIESLTTSTANLVTVLLAVVPSLACLASGVVVLVRRKNS